LKEIELAGHYQVDLEVVEYDCYWSTVYCSW